MKSDFAKIAIGLLVVTGACSDAAFKGDGLKPPRINSLDDADETSRASSDKVDAGNNGENEDPNGRPDRGDGSTGVGAPQGGGGTNLPDGGEIASMNLKLLEPNLVNVPLDVAIFLDNSGSMYNEAQIVRENIAKFISSVSSRTDLKLILVSLETKMAQINGREENAGVRLSEEFKNRGHVQLNFEPGDRSLLATAAAAACPQSSSSLEFRGPDGKTMGLFDNSTNCKTRICGQDVEVPKCNRTDHVNGPVIEKYKDGFQWPVSWYQTGPIPNLSGKLHSEFRPDSKRVYIFISDDDSTIVDEANFLGLVRPFSGRRAPKVFAFAGIPGVTNDNPEAGCSLANFGRSYVSLSKTTGGNVFDICAPDWTNSFESLATSLTEEAATETMYALPVSKLVKKILSVTYDNGQVIPATKYGLMSGNYFRLDMDVVKTLAGREVTIRVQH